MKTEQLIISNFLAGVSDSRIASSLKATEPAVNQTIEWAMHLVREWMACGFHPYFPLDTRRDAIKNRLQFESVLSEIEKWDSRTKPISQLLFRRTRWEIIESQFGVGKTEARDILVDAILKIEHFLTVDEVVRLNSDTANWLKQNANRALTLLERVPSQYGGNRLSHIEFQAAKIE